MAKATVNTPGGQRAFFIDQRYNGGMWYAIGRHHFHAGYATGVGRVTLEFSTHDVLTPPP